MDYKTRYEIRKSLNLIESDICDRKGKSYSGEEDTLANFKHTATMIGMSQYQVWSVYAQKHIDSIMNAIKDNPNKPDEKSEGWIGRIADIRNYFEILLCMLIEDKIVDIYNKDLQGKETINETKLKV